MKLPEKRPETDPGEEMEALREEYAGLHVAGHVRRKTWIVEEFQKNAEALSLGMITDDRLRHQAEGRCQAFKAMLDRDDEVAEAWQQHLADEDAKRRPEELEGGDFGVSYEASR
jgi:hypothetical protein